MTVVTGWHLLGLGRTPWTDVRALCTGLTCAWADYHGFHIRPHDDLPTAAPPYSHLWAWVGPSAVRVRLDGDDGIVGILTTDPDHWPTPTLHEQVDVTIRDAWPHQEDVGPIRLLEVSGPMPITFVTAS